MTIYTGIWVVAHSYEDQVAQVTFELMRKAKELGSKSKEKVTAIIIGSGLEKSLQEPFYYGADEVIAVDQEILKYYDANIYANVLEQLIKKYQPSSILFGADSIGRELAPRIGVRLETGIAADCIDLDMDTEDGINLLLQKKPYLNGQVVVDILCKEKRPQIATIKPGLLPIKVPDISKSGTIIYEEAEVYKDDIFSKIIKIIPKSTNMNDISKADIVVAGGRAFKSREDFDKLYELAELLGGIVGASRPLVQEGWIGEECQIGQSGRIISPKLYISFGISGAAQHTCGLINPGIFIAVNSDPNAAIFSAANYGVVGDANQILDSLISALKFS